jgi:hypothetical protein
VSGRQIFENDGLDVPSHGYPYSINACAIGSLKSCQEWQSFPEHFIGYPYTISLISRLIGYTPNVGSIENIVAACLTSILIFFIALLATGDGVTANVTVMIYAITPVFAVYGLETSAEPFSNACLSVAIWLYVRSISVLKTFEPVWQRWMRWCALVVILLFSLTVKREDVLLAVLLPAILPLIANWKTAISFERVKLLVFLIFGAVLVLVLCAYMRLFQTTDGEVTLLKTYPFTTIKLATFIYYFARSFFVCKWYGGAAFVVAIGAFTCWLRKDLMRVPLIVFIAFSLLYAFHVRSYYEMRSGHIDTAAALRFSMNLQTVWALIAGSGLGTVMMKVRGFRFYRHHTWASIVVRTSSLVVILTSSLIVTMKLRADGVEDETDVRLTPAQKAIQFASLGNAQSNYIVTIEPLIVQMYAYSTVNVVDLGNVSSIDLEDLIDSRHARRFVYLDEGIHQTEADDIRYGAQTQYLHSLPQSIVYNADRFSLVFFDNSVQRK